MQNIREEMGDGRYLYFPGLYKIAIVKCRNELVGMTSYVVVCAVGTEMTHDLDKENREVHECRQDIEYSQDSHTDLPTAPWAPKARAASICYGQNHKKSV